MNILETYGIIRNKEEIFFKYNYLLLISRHNMLYKYDKENHLNLEEKKYSIKNVYNNDDYIISKYYNNNFTDKDCDKHLDCIYILSINKDDYEILNDYYKGNDHGRYWPLDEVLYTFKSSKLIAKRNFKDNKMHYVL